jgi:hypothetical protein
MNATENGSLTSVKQVNLWMMNRFCNSITPEKKMNQLAFSLRLIKLKNGHT